MASGHDNPLRDNAIMLAREIRYLCRFFETEEYARGFCRGNIYVAALSKYRTLECQQPETLRRDSNEGLLRTFPSEGGVLSIRPPGSDIPLRMTGKGPMRLYTNPYVLCMYAGTLPRGGALSTESLRQLQADPKCREFGDWVVVLGSAETFLKRLENAAAKTECPINHWGMVTYCDNPASSDAPSEVEAAFRKDQVFSWQSEFRVTFKNPGSLSPKDFIFGIGDISDSTHVFRTEDFISASWATP